jgi:hypothetical protein
METTSLRSLVKNGAIKNISTLRMNTNGYPYLTFIGVNQSSANVYFSKRAADLMTTNFEEGDSVLNAVKDANIVQVTNAEGETRYKISLSNESSYASQSELESLFGLEAQPTDFDVQAFKSQFTRVASEVNS